MKCPNLYNVRVSCCILQIASTPKHGILENGSGNMCSKDINTVAMLVLLPDNLYQGHISLIGVSFS